MSGISVWCGYLLNTIDVGADWTCKCHTGCVGKIFMTATESTNTSECRNADKTGASSLANLNSHSKIKPDGKRSLWRNGWSEVIAAQPCPTLCDPMDCGATRLPRPWDSPGKNTGVACMPSSRGSSWPREWTQFFCIGGRLFTAWATRETPVKKWLNMENNWNLQMKGKKTQKSQWNETLATQNNMQLIKPVSEAGLLPGGNHKRTHHQGRCCSPGSHCSQASWSVKQTVIRLHGDGLSSDIFKLLALLGK